MPTVAVMVPIHDKPPGVLFGVLSALQFQNPRKNLDEPQTIDVLAILDRAPYSVREQVFVALDIRVLELTGHPGWRSPCIAANAGLAEVSADIVIYNPSDVVQAAGNIDIVRAHFTEHPNSVLFGRVIESNPEMCKGAGHAGPVLQGSDNPRPMTFLTAYPTAALKAIGGWDELFQEGVCYEDDDLAARLWKHGLDFIFDDRFSGIHQSHERVYTGSNASQGYWTDYRVGINRGHMVRKHGRESAIGVVMQDKPRILKAPGRVEWNHIPPEERAS